MSNSVEILRHFLSPRQKIFQTLDKDGATNFYVISDNSLCNITEYIFDICSKSEKNVHIVDNLIVNYLEYLGIILFPDGFHSRLDNWHDLSMSYSRENRTYCRECTRKSTSSEVLKAQESLEIDLRIGTLIENCQGIFIKSDTYSGWQSGRKAFLETVKI